MTATAVHAQETMTMVAPETPPPAPATRSVRTLSVGLSGAYGVMLNSTDGFTLPQAPTCCSEYTGTSGGGVIIGLDASIPLASTLDLGIRLAYQTSSTSFVTDEQVTVRDGSSTTQTAFRHTLETSLGMLVLEPVADWRVAGGLSLIGGIRLGTMLSGTYTQTEAFADPSVPYDFPDGRAVRNESSGDINDLAGLQMGLVIGARYRLPMNAEGSLHLVPEVSYSPMFTDVVENVSWSVSPIRIGVGILFDLTRMEAGSTPLKP
jgi:hypothetical protein